VKYVRQITSQVYLLESTKGAYCYLVKADALVLIDTHYRFNKRNILKELKANQIQLSDIKHIILTHADMDHMGNVASLEELTGATIWAGTAEIPYIMGEKERPSFKKYIAKIMRARKPKYVRPLKDGDEVSGIQVVETPGHTEGHICLIYDDVLFAGDLVEERDGLCIPYPVKWNWNTQILFQSIHKLSAYPFQWVCMAHGSPIIRDELFED